jgi:Uma2 family endonuclease
MQVLETSQPLLIDIRNVTLRLTLAEFQQICLDNPDLNFELTANGELVTMPPVGWESSKKNLNLASQLYQWNLKSRLGEVFDSSGGFVLPSGAVRSPDVTWIAQEKLAGLSTAVTFPAIVPDFVIELRSKSDSLTTLQAKMQEYRENGVRLGWLVNPQQKTVEIYRVGEATAEVQVFPGQLSGEDVLPGLVVDLSEVL